MTLAIRFAVALTVALVACDGPATPVRTSDAAPLGIMQVAIAGEVREVPFGEVTCGTAADHRLVELHFVREAPDGHTAQRPRILIARVRDAEVLEAEAFLPQAQVGQHKYDMLVLVAKRLPDLPQPECRHQVSADGSTELVCNKMNVLPWLDPGERPTGSIKVQYRCP